MFYIGKTFLQLFLWRYYYGRQRRFFSIFGSWMKHNSLTHTSYIETAWERLRCAPELECFFKGEKKIEKEKKRSQKRRRRANGYRFFSGATYTTSLSWRKIYLAVYFFSEQQRHLSVMGQTHAHMFSRVPSKRHMTLITLTFIIGFENT